MVTKFELPKVQDLQFTTIPYDKNCEHLEDAKRKGGLTLGLIDEIKTYCIKTAPYIEYYKKQIEYYNQTATDILTNEIALILPIFIKNERHKIGIITSLFTGFIGLGYEGISSFLHYRRQKALKKVVHVMENNEDIHTEQ